MALEAKKACSPTPLARFSPPALTARRVPATLPALFDRLMILSAVWPMLACSMRRGQSKLAQIVGAGVALPDLAWTSYLSVWAMWVFVNHAAGQPETEAETVCGQKARPSTSRHSSSDMQM